MPAIFLTIGSPGSAESRGRHYSDAPDCERFLDRGKPTYMGGLLEMANTRLYRFWGDLTEALRTGMPQNESKSKSGASPFESLYSDPVNLRLFVQGMTGISLGKPRAIAHKFPWGDFKSFVDVGRRSGSPPRSSRQGAPPSERRGV